MTQRERILAIILAGAVLLVGGGFILFFYLWPGMNQARAEMNRLEDSITAKKTQIENAEIRKNDLERWRKQSLPVNPDKPDLKWTSGEYEIDLSKKLNKDGFVRTKAIQVKTIENPTGPAKPGSKVVPPYTKVTFKVEGHATLANFVKFLGDFYSTPLLHQIRILKVHKPRTDRQTRGAELDIDFTIEALVLKGGEQRTTLLPKDPPKSPSLLADPSRSYDNIAAKDIFFGMGPGRPDSPRGPVYPDATNFIRLTSITKDGNAVEARLYDVSSNDKPRLRAERGFDSFVVRNEKGETVMRCIVDRIELDNHRIVIHTDKDKKYYQLRFGETLAEALRKPLKDEEKKSLGLASIETDK